LACYSDYFPEYQLPSEEDIKALKVADLVAFLGHHKVDTKVLSAPLYIMPSQLLNSAQGVLGQRRTDVGALIEGLLHFSSEI
jgi:hypothetical protein